jgi:ferredoxin-NADP reductase
VLRDALAHGHRGPITLVHAGATPASLYLRAELRELAQTHANLHVREIVSLGAEAEPGLLEQGSVIELAGQLIERSANPAAWLCFVGGDQEIVKALRLQIFLAGAASARILADPFVVTPPLQSRLAGCSAS